MQTVLEIVKIPYNTYGYQKFIKNQKGEGKSFVESLAELQEPIV